MNAEDALRFLAHEAAWCRDRDQAEFLCLLVPTIGSALALRPMDGRQADEFRRELKKRLNDAVKR